MKLILIIPLIGLPFILLASTNSHSDYVYRPVLDQDFVVPRVLVDPETKVSYFLDSDGRHISAVAPSGGLIWRVDPFVEAKLFLHQGLTPLIVYFAFPDKQWQRATRYKSSDFILLTYNSSQFGRLRKTNGQFTYEGED